MKKILFLGFLTCSAGSWAQTGTRDDPQVCRIRSSVSDCWLIKGESVVMVDAGIAQKYQSFKRQIKRHHVKPEEIKLVVITHGHFDHMGMAGKIRELTGAPIAIHESDRSMMEEGGYAIPEGITAWGRTSRKLLGPFFKKVVEKQPLVTADIVIGNEPYPLEEYGISGRIIYTPGHTMGSVSVLLDNGKAFVGCMAHNRLPFTLKPKLPIYANYPELFPDSWAKLISLGAKEIYPGHGPAFPLKRMHFPPEWNLPSPNP